MSWFRSRVWLTVSWMNRVIDGVGETYPPGYEPLCNWLVEVLLWVQELDTYGALPLS
jgi:hypothetical protein